MTKPFVLRTSLTAGVLLGSVLLLAQTGRPARAGQTTAPTPGTLQYSYVAPLSVEERIARLEGRLDALQNQVEQLKDNGLTLGEVVLTNKRPAASIRCTGFGLSSPNDIMARVKTIGYQAYPDGVMFPIWSGCRSN